MNKEKMNFAEKIIKHIIQKTSKIRQKNVVVLYFKW